MAPSKLAGKRILIIGGSSGIGFAVAAHAYSQGATILLSSSNADRLARAVTRLTEVPNGSSAAPPSYGSIQTLTCDLNTPHKLESNIAALFTQARTALATPSGPCLDHIVFTASGSPELVPLSGLSLDAAHRNSLLRLWAPTLVAKHSAGYLGTTNECSLTFTSGAAAQKVSGPGWVMMAGVNAGVEGVARALAVELKPVRVNVVSPGPVATEMWDVLPEAQKLGLWAQLRQGLATGTIGKAEDVAEAYVYLMKDYGCSAAVVETNGGGLVS